MASGGPDDRAPEIQVFSKDGQLQIHFCCKNKPGMLPDLMEAVERLGFLFDEVTASCHPYFTFDGVATQITGHQAVDANEVRTKLLSLVQGKACESASQ
eukprot:c21045_g1_i5 orf=340-636(+)